MIPKIVYCKKCHKPIQVPKIAGQINVASGFVTVECGNCKNKVKVKTNIMNEEKKFTIYQHVPNYIEAEGKKASFNTKEELLEVPFVKNKYDWEGHTFNYFALSITKIIREENKFQYVLMAIYDNEDYWWPIGYIEPNPTELNLPIWELKKEKV